METVWMFNEETGGYAQTTRESFEEHWRLHGWQVKDPSQEEIDAMNVQVQDIVPTMISVTHPEVDAVAEVTEEAFNEVWGPKGWQRAAVSEGGSPEPEVQSGSGPDAPLGGDNQ